jgi:hypothetical protein
MTTGRHARAARSAALCNIAGCRSTRLDIPLSVHRQTHDRRRMRRDVTRRRSSSGSRPAPHDEACARPPSIRNSMTGKARSMQKRSSPDGCRRLFRMSHPILRRESSRHETYGFDIRAKPIVSGSTHLACTPSRSPAGRTKWRSDRLWRGAPGTGRRTADPDQQVQSGADYPSAPAGGERHAHRGELPQAPGHGADVLSMAEEVRRAAESADSRAAPASRSEPEAQATRRGPEALQDHPAGLAARKW